VAAGDKVAVLSRNSHAFAALRFALARLGAVDASYLELARRRGAPLATLDAQLHKASLKLGRPQQ
jgi:predicted nucleic acid-binding protein